MYKEITYEEKPNHIYFVYKTYINICLSVVYLERWSLTYQFFSFKFYKL